MNVFYIISNLSEQHINQLSIDHILFKLGMARGLNNEQKQKCKQKLQKLNERLKFLNQLQQKKSIKRAKLYGVKSKLLTGKQIKNIEDNKNSDKLQIDQKLIQKKSWGYSWQALLQVFKGKNKNSLNNKSIPSQQTDELSNMLLQKSKFEKKQKIN